MNGADIRGTTVPWLLEGYLPIEGSFDEMMAAPGILRPHCEPLVQSLETLGRHEFLSRCESARRAIRENGITYNIYGDPQGLVRPWELDLVPRLLSSAEWSRLEAGLVQRTRLLNLIVADLYGAQRLLREGLLPPGGGSWRNRVARVRIPYGLSGAADPTDFA